MRRMPFLLLAALAGCDDRGESGSDRELVPLPRRTDREGDRYEVELRSRSVRTGDEATAESLSATMRYADEVLAVESERATRVRRSFPASEGGEPAVVEVDLRENRGRGGRTDHFRQFERLLPSVGYLGEECRMDGALGAPPSSVLGVSEAAWLNSRCACKLVRVAVLDGWRVAEFDVRITFEGGPGPSRLDGTMRFDLDGGLLREVALHGSADGMSYELQGVQTVVPAGSAR
jgi:hypothetical protein